MLVRLPKRYEWLLALGALYRLGAVAVLCPELTPAAELAARARQLGVRTSLLEPGDVALADSQSPASAPGADAPAFVIFTSGSTGEPKAAVHARRYVRANWLQTIHWMGVQPGDRVWCTAGTGWAKSLRNTWLAPVAARRRDRAARGALRPRRAPASDRPPTARGALHVAHRVPTVCQVRRVRAR